MFTHRGTTHLIISGFAVVTLTVGLAGAAPAGAGTAPPGAAVAATAVDPIVGQWSYQGGIVEVTGSGTEYVGRIVQATSFNQCVHPVGQQMWTIHGSGGSYSGTHVGFNLTDCSDLRMAANWSLSDGGSGTYSLRLCAEAGCATLQRAVPIDTTPPTVTLKGPSGIVRIGREFAVDYSATDDSGEAELRATLYSGGDVVFTDETDGLVTATGKQTEGTLSPVEGAAGPFYLCMSARDAAGNESVNYPQSACVWLSIQVPVSLVSNGCGGAQWGSTAEAVQNWLLDTQKYGGVTVDFRSACNQHDAGYAGVTVADPFMKRIVDFRTWSRAKVDAKFLQNLRTLCHTYLDGHVSRRTLSTCLDGPAWADYGLTAAITTAPGAGTYFEGVRAEAEGAYDTNVTLSGTQTISSPETWPVGGGRTN